MPKLWKYNLGGLSLRLWVFKYKFKFILWYVPPLVLIPLVTKLFFRFERWNNFGAYCISLLLMFGNTISYYNKIVSEIIYIYIFYGLALYLFLSQGQPAWKYFISEFITT